MVDGFDELATATTTTAADAAAAAQKAAEHVDPYYHVQPQSAMPNPFKFAVNAGDVCLFDTTYVMTCSAVPCCSSMATFLWIFASGGRVS